MDEEIQFLMEVVNERILYRNYLIETKQVEGSEKEELEEEIKKLKIGIEKIMNIYKEEIKMKNRLEDIKAIIKTQNDEGYRVNNLNISDTKWLIEQSERQTENADRLNRIKEIIKAQEEERFSVNKLNALDMNWLIEQAI